MDYSNQRLLVISNIVFSENTNTGKTLYSYFDSLPKENVRQLYFSGETPSVLGYRYFRIYDRDIIKGKLTPSKRGSEIEPIEDKNAVYDWYGESSHSYGDLARLCREILWYKSWKSKQLWDFLDDFNPTAVFFVGGDFCAAYDIAISISNRYNARLSLYLTDDYLFPRKADGIIGSVRRKLINKSFKKTLARADVFFTISDVMREEYFKKYGRDSSLIVNMPESLKDESIKPDGYAINLTYAGSMGLGRDKVMRKISEAVEKYNLQLAEGEPPVIFTIYSNSSIEFLKKSNIAVGKHTVLGGQLNSDELRYAFNKSDVLVFVESFDEENIEITKFSLSTKVPEYMSLGKPILAVGPSDIGSMKALANVSYCINDCNNIHDKIIYFFSNKNLMNSIGESAENEFRNIYAKGKAQSNLLKLLFAI
ncbi:glycosyltransferase family protein [Pseudobutyrivibrio xylanivorans]|uniref:Uncharacterized protein n=1 Tax=Pseudobutyrivibrio xylanivorans DSM 14809 TaxID=1123012 RepID=A0A1M6KP39_PSEXY|nr:hypothetical protein [Pseudobutyrivibrio xylanivorans]SHJ60651.1 hypothetical protein SAMN02745725_02909 [Pseudobutyrivibrio xylanivorans DSM 14809]